VIATNETGHADVMQQTGQHDLLVLPGLQRVRGALQYVIGRPKTVLEEIDQRGLRRHLLQARIVAHHELARARRRWNGLRRVAVA
jgi:hypothetical protein